MNQTNKPQLFEAERASRANERLKTHLKGELPFFGILVKVAMAQGIKTAKADTERGKKRKPFMDTRTVLHVALAATSYNDIPSLHLQADEELCPLALNWRRREQAERLFDWIKEVSLRHTIDIPHSLGRMCTNIIAVWQPTCINPDRLQEMLHYVSLSPQQRILEALACIGTPLMQPVKVPKNRDVVLAQAAIMYGYSMPQHTELMEVLNCLMIELGSASVALANTREIAHCHKALRSFEILMAHGATHAGLDAAHMYLHGWGGVPSGGPQLERACKIIDHVYDKWRAQGREVLMTEDGVTRLLTLRNSIKLNTILANKKNSELVAHHVNDLVDNLLSADQLGLQGNISGLRLLVNPERNVNTLVSSGFPRSEITDFSRVREVIDSHQAVREWCHQVYQEHIAQNSAHLHTHGN